MQCDLCGTEQGPFYKGDVEGVQMTTCGNCKRYGKNVKAIPAATNRVQRSSTQPPIPAATKELIQIITPHYAKRIKQARERQGMKQEQLAKQLAEKESIIHSLESGKHEPSITLARKLEKHLGIQLVEQHEEEHHSSQKSASGPLTIGDLIKKR